MRKTSFLTMLLLGLISATTVACAQVQLCAATQTYSALERIKEHSPVSFEVKYGIAEDLEALLSDPKNQCELLLSDDEKLSIVQVRSGRADPAQHVPLVRAPLVLWSADPKLLDSKATAVAKKRLKSLALPRAELTPVGYATSLIVAKKNFPTKYLNAHIYRAEQEYQVFALVEGGNVQAGFLTKPLIMDERGLPRGSYWQVPRSNYPDLNYYLTPLKIAMNDPEAQKLNAYLRSAPEVKEAFVAAGFALLEDDY